MLIPVDKKNPGIIIEFKKVNKHLNETLEKAADNALFQIKEKYYSLEFMNHGAEKIFSIAIAFTGKKILIKN